MAEPVVRPEREPKRDRSFSDEALFLTDAPAPGRARRSQDAAASLWTQTITDWTTLEALRPEWRDLAASASEPNPFYEAWSLLPALRTFAGRERVEVVLAYRGDVLCGLFPMVYRRSRAEMWMHPYCYLGAPLLRKGHERTALRCWLDAVGRRTPAIRLQDVPGDGCLRLHLVDELYERAWPSLVSQAYTRAVLRPASTAEEFFVRALATKRRREFRRQRARLSELGRLTIEELPEGADPRPLIAEFLTLEAAGWKGREGVASLSDRAYLEEMAAGAALERKLQMLALRLDGRPVALKINLFAGEGAFAFKITFDEEFSRFSPGVLLELDNVEKVHGARPLRWMDSCAAPNRFMINHLWPDRREMQTVFFATGSRRGELAVAAVPLLHFFRRLTRRA
jgi:CelD/BcsL family acetyltransferase involved in cellulose biosynthesis